MEWRLGLDVGTNSIGWAVVELDENEKPVWLADSGARIFSDGRNPKDGQSMAATRREPRGARRNRDRYLKRRAELMDLLIEYGLMPKDKAARKAIEKKDPWELRVRGLDKELSLYELGRAIFHLQQRRGFKSNRKTDKGDDDKGKIKSAAKRVTKHMEKEGARTLGELLARPRLENKKAAATTSVRARLNGSGAKAFYKFYPTRAMIQDEFDALWTKQKEFHGDILTDDVYDALGDPIKGTLFFQRPLKPQPVGKCTLDPVDERAPKALPSVQRLRIYQEVNHLELRKPGGAAYKLTLDERDKIANKLLKVGKLAFDSMRTLIKQPDVRFSIESEKRKHLDGDKTSAILASKKLWGPSWRDLPAAEQERIVERLQEEEDEDRLVDELRQKHGLASDIAEAVVNAPLPDGHGRLGRRATGRLLTVLKQDVITYDEAVVRAGYGSHSDLDSHNGEFFAALPYYGKVLERHVAFGTGEPDDREEKRYGKIANPTVHVALNQIRKVTNALIKRHGAPTQIVVELARDLPLSAEGKRELEKRQKENQNANKKRSKYLIEYGQRDTYANRMRMRLWEELNQHNPADRRCVYTGEQIGMARLFADEVEIEHILPFSQTLDDSFSNKTLSMRKANRDKGPRSPFAAFSESPDEYMWEDISERSANLPNNKAWRFGPDAMERFEDEERGFLARQLNETRYIARLTKIYLQRTGAEVWVTPGRLTHDLRWAWGLDSVLAGHNTEEAADPKKNRKNHRHHAIDAVVIALTDRALVQAVATAAARAEEKYEKNWLKGWSDPWPEFRNNVRDSINHIVVSHRADHGTEKRLHNDTAYGIVVPDNDKGISVVVHRVPLSSLKKPDQLNAIRDDVIRASLVDETQGLTGNDFTNALLGAGEAMSPPVRKVRILETLSVIPIKDQSGCDYKAYKGDGNYCYDIFEGSKGKWGGDIVSRFAANQKGFNRKSNISVSGKPLIMRLRNNDMLAIEESGERRILRIVKMSKGQIALAGHQEAGSLKSRDKDKDDPFRYLTVSPSRLQKLNARLVHVDAAGRLFDPGPPK